MADEEQKKQLNRRDIMRIGLITSAGIAIGGVSLSLVRKSSSQEMVWQIDPNVCNQCGKCSTNCVLPQSAVKCVHSYSMCGYCDLCSGYLETGAQSRDTGAENQQCPTGALKRKFIEDLYFQYAIDEKLCIGCGKCVKGCRSFGNGSLYLQVRHDRCLHCNECSIARSCPSQAYRRVPAENPYILRGEEAKKITGG
jgi:Na+-translocating ferredoxin:NAD+ oxidoreductase subunit B